MEKGFNDDELADIMNEIESLEKEFTEEVDSKTDNLGDDMNNVEKEEFLSDTEEMSAELDEVAESSDGPFQDDDSFAEDSFEEDDFEEDIFEDEVLDSKPILDEDTPIFEAPKAVLDQQELGTLRRVTQLPINHVVPEPTNDSKIDHTKNGSALTGYGGDKSAQTSMSFNVQGNMHLHLSFNISGKVVDLSVNDNGLELELDGGMKFSIPLDVSQKGKKAA